MFRKLTVLLLALLLPASVLAEVYEGTTAALSAVTVTAERAGVVGAAVEAGSRVGKLTVVEGTGERRGGYRVWRCRCA